MPIYQSPVKMLMTSMFRNSFVTGWPLLFKITKSIQDKRSGEKIRAEDFKQRNGFCHSVVRSVSDQDLGVIYISLDPAVLYRHRDITRGHTPMAVTVTYTFDTEIFILVRQLIGENWLVGLTIADIRVRVAVPQNFVLQGTVTSSALIVGLSLLFVSFFI